MSNLLLYLSNYTTVSTKPLLNRAMYINTEGLFIILPEKEQHFVFDQKYIDKNTPQLRSTGGLEFRRLGYIKINSRPFETYICLNKIYPTKAQLNAIFDFWVFCCENNLNTFIILNNEGKKWRVLLTQEMNILEEIDFLYKSSQLLEQ